jgi:hypothetical protein
MTNLIDSLFHRPSGQGVPRGLVLPIIYLVLGAVIFVAQAATGSPGEGFLWFLVWAALAAVFALGGRFDLIRQARGDLVDEREGSIHLRAMASTGTVLVIALTGMIVIQLARGVDPTPYTQLMTAGGATYLLSLFLNR